MIRLTALVVLLLGASSCVDPASRWVPGGLYTVSAGEAGFGVVKILAIEPGAVSVKIYRETFDDRPTRVAPYQLSLGSVDDEEGFGIGHVPVDPDEFAFWFPVFLREEPVTDEELDGYRIWKESGGGVFSSELLESIETEEGQP